jgi:hypothetical protein
MKDMKNYRPREKAAFSNEAFIRFSMAGKILKQNQNYVNIQKSCSTKKDVLMIILGNG